MESRIRYDICPECGFDNAEKKGACPACDNRLFSDGEEEHRRYVQLVASEHRKRSVQWILGWVVVTVVFCYPLVQLVRGRVSWVPGASAWVGAMVIGWRLIDAKKKRDASAQFLAKHKDR